MGKQFYSFRTRLLRRRASQETHFFGIAVAILLLLFVSGCAHSDKSKVLEQYDFEENVPVSGVVGGKKLAPWVKEGVTCFGIMIVYDQEKKPTKVKEFMAKIVRIDSEQIKMRALVNVTYKSVKCKLVYGIRKGEFWDEKEGDVFRTREEAIAYIDQKFPGLRIQ